MRQLAPLAAVYLLVVALVLPASPLAAGDAAAPAGQAGAPAQAAPQEPAPAEPGPAPAPQAPAAQPEPAGAGDGAAGADAPAQQDAPAQGDAQDEPGSPKARAAAPGSVTMRDFSFSPRTITVKQGETVTWRNEGREPHSATASDGSFDTGTFGGGASRSERFDEAGTFAYICTPHPFMKGTVRVLAASAGSQGEESGSGAAAGSGSGGSAAGAGGSEPAAGAGSAGEPGRALPKSGIEAEALALLGVLMLALGAAVRRRTVS